MKAFGRIHCPKAALERSCIVMKWKISYIEPPMLREFCCVTQPASEHDARTNDDASMTSSTHHEQDPAHDAAVKEGALLPTGGCPMLHE